MNVYGQLVAAQLENATSDPATTVVGRAIYRTDTGFIKVYTSAWKSVVDDSTSQVITNKTLGSTNTITGATAASFTNGGTVTLPSGSVTLASLTGTEAFTNKDYQGGTASDTSRITVPKASLSTLTGLTRKQATIVYNTDSNQLMSDDGTNLNPIGGGAGEKNYVATGASTATGWTASGAGITVATDTTGSNLPRPNTTLTGIKFTGVSGSTAYAYYRFILDDADVGKKLKIQFDMKPGTAVASDFKVDVYSNTANDYTTGNARIPLSTDASAISALPNLTGTYRTTFDSPAATAQYIEVRIGMNAPRSATKSKPSLSRRGSSARAQKPRTRSSTASIRRGVNTRDNRRRCRSCSGGSSNSRIPGGTSMPLAKMSSVVPRPDR